MGKRRRGGGRAAAQQSSDGESSDAESVSGVWQLGEAELRGRLAAQPKLTPEPEIDACEESIRKKADEKARPIWRSVRNFGSHMTRKQWQKMAAWSIKWGR